MCQNIVQADMVHLDISFTHVPGMSSYIHDNTSIHLPVGEKSELSVHRWRWRPHLLVGEGALPLGLVAPRVSDAHHRDLALYPGRLNVRQARLGYGVGVALDEAIRHLRFSHVRIRLGREM